MKRKLLKVLICLCTVMLIMGGCGDDGRGGSSQSSGSERDEEAEADGADKDEEADAASENDKTDEDNAVGEAGGDNEEDDRSVLLELLLPEQTEEENVADDRQVCDDIHRVVVTAMMDPETLMSQESKDYMSFIESQEGGVPFSDIVDDSSTYFVNSIRERLDIIDSSDIILHSHSDEETRCSVDDIMVSITSNRCYIWIEGSDVTGNMDGSSGTVISVY